MTAISESTIAVINGARIQAVKNGCRMITGNRRPMNEQKSSVERTDITIPIITTTSIQAIGMHKTEKEKNNSQANYHDQKYEIIIQQTSRPFLPGSD